MTNPHQTPSRAAEPDTAPVGWWDRAAIIALGGAGCALSYDALQQMAIAIHVRPQLSYLFPLVIDGFIAYGIRALLVLSTAPLRARLYTWTLFATATTASIWANALHAVRLNQQTHSGGLRLGDHVVAVLSTIAPLALAGAVHLYILITRHHPTHNTKNTKPKPDRDQPTTPDSHRADPDGTIRTGPHDHLRHTVRADHTPIRDHDLQTERTTDREWDPRTGGPEGTSGPQNAPSDHAEAGPPRRTTRPDHPTDHPTDHPADHPADHQGADHSGPADRTPTDHDAAPTQADHGFEPADRSPEIDPADQPQDQAQQPTAEPHTPTDNAAHSGPKATASKPEEASPGQPAPEGTIAIRSGETATEDQPSADPAAKAGDYTSGPADGTGAEDQAGRPADQARTAAEDRQRKASAGPDHPADHNRAGDRPSERADHDGGPAEGTAGPGRRSDHQPGDHRTIKARRPAQESRSGPETASIGDQPGARTADRTTIAPAGSAGDASGPAGLEELLSIAREAALAEGRMTRRALRPYLNQAGVPISNSRFTELQRRLYADPTLAHLPRPGKRT